MKPAYFLVIAILLTFSTCKKKDDPAPVVKNKTLRIYFQKDEQLYGFYCNHNVKYAGTQVSVTYLSDTLFTGFSESVEGLAIFSDIKPLDYSQSPLIIKWTTSSATPVVGSFTIYGDTASGCFQDDYSPSETMRVNLNFQ
jgi:hypothetical protein